MQYAQYFFLQTFYANQVESHLEQIIRNILKNTDYTQNALNFPKCFQSSC